MHVCMFLLHFQLFASRRFPRWAICMKSTRSTIDFKPCQVLRSDTISIAFWRCFAWLFVRITYRYLSPDMPPSYIPFFNWHMKLLTTIANKLLVSYTIIICFFLANRANAHFLHWNTAVNDSSFFQAPSIQHECSQISVVLYRMEVVAIGPWNSIIWKMVWPMIWNLEGSENARERNFCTRNEN